jgi:hypothetical protein
LAPGPLRKAAGLRYQEFTNLAAPLPLNTSIADAATASARAEFLIPENAEN